MNWLTDPNWRPETSGVDNTHPDAAHHASDHDCPDCLAWRLERRVTPLRNRIAWLRNQLAVTEKELEDILR